MLFRSGRVAFTDCLGLTKIKMPKSIKTIARWAFSGCVSLAEVHIPAGIESIDSEAFALCPNVTVHFGGTKREWAKAMKNKKVKVIFAK